MYLIVLVSCRYTQTNILGFDGRVAQNAMRWARYSVLPCSAVSTRSPLGQTHIVIFKLLPCRWNVFHTTAAGVSMHESSRLVSLAAITLPRYLTLKIGLRLLMENFLYHFSAKLLMIDERLFPLLGFRLFYPLFCSV